MSMHPCEHKAFMRFYDGKMQYEKEETLMGQGSSHLRRNMEDRDSSIICVSAFMIATNKYKKCHTQQESFD